MYFGWKEMQTFILKWFNLEMFRILFKFSRGVENNKKKVKKRQIIMCKLPQVSRMSSQEENK